MLPSRHHHHHTRKNHPQQNLQDLQTTSASSNSYVSEARGKGGAGCGWGITSSSLWLHYSITIPHPVGLNGDCLVIEEPIVWWSMKISRLRLTEANYSLIFDVASKVIALTTMIIFVRLFGLWYFRAMAYPYVSLCGFRWSLDFVGPCWHTPSPASHSSLAARALVQKTEN